MRYFLPIIISFCVIASIFLSSCFKEDFRDSPDTFLEFSTDTLSFDTVFTTLGSATRSFKIYNPYNESVEIESIILKDDANGFFRLNIDGLQGNVNEGVEILPKDSIYVFAEVTVDPDQPLSSSPFVIEDYVLVNTNGNQQQVLLQAWGQNANYIPSSSAKGGQALLSCDFGTVTWDDDKPYVIYGILAIDSCELIIPPATDIYVHGGIAFTDSGVPYNDGIIVVLADGTLTVNGTFDEPVTIQGDRLEMEFADVSGQWGGIIVSDLSTGNSFKHTTIKNSIVGVRVDSLASARFEKCQFYNQSANGLLGYHAASVYAENCLFYNAGSATVSLQYGGNYELNYCTMASYNSGGTALAASNFRCSESTCLGPLFFNPIDIKMTNCLMVGDDIDEIIFVDRSEDPTDFNYQLTNCFVQIEELLEVNEFANFFANCENCDNVNSMDTIFLNPAEFDFSLDTMSIAIEQAIPLNDIPDDILGNSRDAINPDIGCYEFQ